LKSASFGIVFFFSAIAARIINQFLGLAQTACPREVRVNWFVVGDIFSVINRGALNFGDGVVNFVNGRLLSFFQFAAVGTYQQAARHA
jgi:hypothetical protein